MKLNYLNLLILALVLSSCQTIDDKLKFRIDSLYEHAIMMGEYSTSEQLRSVGLDMSKINKAENMDEDEKIIQMGKAFNVSLSGTYENKVTLLEKRMNVMMEKWEKIS